MTNLVNFWQRVKEVYKEYEISKCLPILKEAEFKRVIFSLNGIAKHLDSGSPLQDSIYELSKAMQMNFLNQHLSILLQSVHKFTNSDAREAGIKLVNDLHRMNYAWLNGESHGPEGFQQFKEQLYNRLCQADKEIGHSLEVAVQPAWKRCLKRISNALNWLVTGAQGDHQVFKRYSFYAEQFKETATDQRLFQPFPGKNKKFASR